MKVSGQTATRLGPPFHPEHLEVPWRLVVGRRNRLVHDYDGVDEARLWRTASEDLPGFYRQIVRVQEATLPVYLRQAGLPPENPEPGQTS